MTDIGTDKSDIEPAHEPIPPRSPEAPPSSTDKVAEGVSALLRDRFLLGR